MDESALPDYETLITPGSTQLLLQSQCGSTPIMLETRPTALNRSSQPVGALRRIASSKEGARSERSIVSFLVSKKPKRKGNNIHGQSGTERCTFCAKSKKKCIFYGLSEDFRCRRCEELGLACSEKKRPGADRVLRRLTASSKDKIHRTLQLQGPHDLEILPNDRWEIVQRPYFSTRRSIIGITDLPCSREVKASCLELERYIRHIIFGDRRWRPATNTSAIITLLPKDGFRRRFWVNGTLIGMREGTEQPIRETCLMIERCPRFPSLQSLEEYVRMRLPNVDASPQEVHAIASQIDKRFLVVGAIDVREFRLSRKEKTLPRKDKSLPRRRRYITIVLRWEIEGETWGLSTWKAYFEIMPFGQIHFMSSRVSCHIAWHGCWVRERLPAPWTLPLLRGNPPVEHVDITSRALIWLQLFHSPLLKKIAVNLSIEDDPITGMPEDIEDGASMKSVKDALGIVPPPEVTPTNLKFDGWRLVPPEDSIVILKKISEITVDPNIIPPNIAPPSHINGDWPPLFRPRIPLRPHIGAPPMMVVMLRDFGPDSFPSGFIVKEEERFGTNPAPVPQLHRQPVAFKSSSAVVHPDDLQRFINSDVSRWEIPARDPLEASGVQDAPVAPVYGNVDDWAQAMLNLEDADHLTQPV